MSGIIPGIVSREVPGMPIFWMFREYRYPCQVNFTWMITFKALIVLPENVRELFVGADEFFYLRTNFLFGFLKKRVFGVSSAAMPPLMPVWHVDHAHGIHFTISFGTRACCTSLG